MAKSAQAGAKSAQQGFNRFVEGPTAGGYEAVPGGDESKRAFWDDFSNVADQRNPGSSSIGTAAMGKGAPSRGPHKEVMIGTTGEANQPLLLLLPTAEGVAGGAALQTAKRIYISFGRSAGMYVSEL